MQLILLPEQCHSYPVGKTLKHQSITKTSIHYIPHMAKKHKKYLMCLFVFWIYLKIATILNDHLHHSQHDHKHDHHHLRESGDPG